MTRRILVAALIFFFCLFFTPARARAQESAPTGNSCGGESQQGCPCGKLPVCVFSGHSDGQSSAAQFSEKDTSSWEGFGGDLSDYLTAMVIEDQVAAAIAAANPCLDVIAMDSYPVGAVGALDQAKNFGLDEQLRQAREAGDTKRVEELSKQVDDIYAHWGAGDFPWRDPDLAGEQMMGRITNCISNVRLSAKAGDGRFEVSAQTSVSAGNALDNAAASSTSDSPQGGVGELAKQVAGQLAGAQQKLFCTCEMVFERCTVTNFDLANQESECVRVKSCCGQTIKEEPEKEKVKGISFGESRKYESKCCSPFVRAREGKDEVDPEDKEVFDEIWCPGGWNMRWRDLDCDGVPNAQDPTPRPAEGGS